MVFFSFLTFLTFLIFFNWKLTAGPRAPSPQGAARRPAFGRCWFWRGPAGPPIFRTGGFGGGGRVGAMKKRGRCWPRPGSGHGCPLSPALPAPGALANSPFWAVFSPFSPFGGAGGVSSGGPTPVLGILGALAGLFLPGGPCASGDFGFYSVGFQLVGLVVRFWVGSPMQMMGMDRKWPFPPIFPLTLGWVMG